MGKYDCVYEWDITSYERDMEKQGGRGNDDKNCDVDIRGEKRHSGGDMVKTGDGCT
ncbi:hypothetical protein KY285_007133 [Solanum tuberosum]|nr:hypothetical protein KY285_007133 [Solanum tuberosum]